MPKTQAPPLNPNDMLDILQSLGYINSATLQDRNNIWTAAHKVLQAIKTFEQWAPDAISLRYDQALDAATAFQRCAEDRRSTAARMEQHRRELIRRLTWLKNDYAGWLADVSASG